MDLLDLAIMAFATLSVFIPATWSVLRVAGEYSQIEDDSQQTTIEL